MGSDESHFNVSLIVRVKVTRQCPQTTIFEEKREPTFVSAWWYHSRSCYANICMWRSRSSCYAIVPLAVLTFVCGGLVPLAVLTFVCGGLVPLAVLTFVCGGLVPLAVLTFVWRSRSSCCANICVAVSFLLLY